MHVHHHGLEADDPFNADAPGSAVQPFAAPAESEPVIVKHGSSGFVNTPLEAELRGGGIERLILCGATANHCVESTTRSSADLGFETIYAADAVWAYAVTGPDGVEHSAEQVHSTSLSTLHGEIATVMTTEKILSS